MTATPHFQIARSWKVARTLLTFDPRRPADTAGLRLRSIRIYVRDRKLREVPFGERTLEAHYGGFTLSQTRRSVGEARRLAVEVLYGQVSREDRIAGHPARVYEAGPEPGPDDIDGRSPAVVVWHDGEMLYLVASYEMSADALVRIAGSLYR